MATRPEFREEFTLADISGGESCRFTAVRSLAGTGVVLTNITATLASAGTHEFMRVGGRYEIIIRRK